MNSPLKSTKGPWHYNEDLSQHGTRLIYGYDRYLVADAGRIHRRTEEEMTANAQLIAAAPDLLRVAKNFVEDVTWALQGKSAAELTGFEEIVQALVRDFNYAITKAEGL